MVTVILPAYNEAHNIGPIVRGLASLENVRAIIVNDASRDETGTVAQLLAMKYPWVSVVNHAVNMGLGGALRTGLMKAAEDASPSDVIITMDADNTMSTKIIPELVKQATRGGLAVASRYCLGAVVVGVPWPRRIISLSAAWLCQATVRIPGLRDYTSGYRAYSAAIVKQGVDRWGSQLITSRTFECQFELLRKLSPYIDHAYEVPILLDYTSQRGRSTLQFWKTVKGYLRELAATKREGVRAWQ